MTETLNIYKTDEWTAVILTDVSGVLDVQIFFNPISEYARRIAQRGRRYKQRPRVELPEIIELPQRTRSGHGCNDIDLTGQNMRAKIQPSKKSRFRDVDRRKPVQPTKKQSNRVAPDSLYTCAMAHKTTRFKPCS